MFLGATSARAFGGKEVNLSGWESVLPPLFAIGLAIIFRRVVVPLAAGVLLGAFILGWQRGSLVEALLLFFRGLIISVFDFDHLRVLAFSLLLGAMVGVLEAGGGFADLIGKFAQRIKSRVGGQLLIACSGLVIFFDDYANTLLIGGTMRQSADRYRISREKLAYLVDSTAAPIAGLSVVSTWAATEISYMQEGLAAAGINQPTAGLQMFLYSIPYRFYPVLAIVMVFVIALRNRDFGPMHAAEAKAATQEDQLSGATASGTGIASEGQRPAGRLWLAGVVPVSLCVLSVTATLVWTGYAARSEPVPGNWFLQSIDVIGNGDSYLGLIIGGVVGLVSAWGMHVWLGGSSTQALLRGGGRGTLQMMPAMFILWFAWALSWMTDADQLDTGGHLAGVLSDRLAPWLLPSIVFVMAGGIAFATGTSWGTMAILTPLAIELAVRLQPDLGAAGPVALATCGSVLAGAIFGDHCSPISDTTVLSSRSSGCDHLAHVKTQFPYALAVGIVCIVAGTIPAGLGVSPWLCLLMGVVWLLVIVGTLGKPCGVAKNRKASSSGHE